MQRELCWNDDDYIVIRSEKSTWTQSAREREEWRAAGRELTRGWQRPSNNRIQMKFDENISDSDVASCTAPPGSTEHPGMFDFVTPLLHHGTVHGQTRPT